MALGGEGDPSAGVRFGGLRDDLLARMGLGGMRDVAAVSIALGGLRDDPLARAGLGGPREAAARSEGFGGEGFGGSQDDMAARMGLLGPRHGAAARRAFGGLREDASMRMGPGDPRDAAQAMMAPFGSAPGHLAARTSYGCPRDFDPPLRMVDRHSSADRFMTEKVVPRALPSYLDELRLLRPDMPSGEGRETVVPDQHWHPETADTLRRPEESNRRKLGQDSQQSRAASDCLLNHTGDKYISIDGQRSWPQGNGQRVFVSQKNLFNGLPVNLNVT